MEQTAARRCTVEEHFALERESEFRHEVFEGEVFAMAGASTTHNTLVLNCALALRIGLRGRAGRAGYLPRASSLPSNMAGTTTTPMYS